MIEAQAVLAVFTLIGCLVNIVVCIWDHDTRQLLPWCVAFLGWFVAICQLMIRMNKGESE